MSYNDEQGTVLYKYPFLSEPRIAQLREIAEYCIENKKVFLIQGGYDTIRKNLIARGWIEKFERGAPNRSISPVRTKPSNNELSTDLPAIKEKETLTEYHERCENIIMSRIAHTHFPDFYWATANVHFELPDKTLYNRISRSWFTCKSGLCAALQQMYWHYIPGVANTPFPRCYHTSYTEQLQDFIDDFRMTACMSMLKYFLNEVKKHGMMSVFGTPGTIGLAVLLFSIERCKDYISFVAHEDLDIENINIFEEDWNLFLENHYSFISGSKKFIFNDLMNTEALCSNAKKVLNDMAAIWPQYDIDGMYNIWILKPENKSRGIGIYLENRCENIYPIVSQSKHVHARYVIQKYLEKPLLIYNTKFDIRQWFMVTSAEPLEIWMYQDCYLRFSSREFTLLDFDTSIHLTNHAVQKYCSNGKRSAKLPECNMWDVEAFKLYLNDNGHADKWDTVIFPGMKEALVGTLLASQDNLTQRERSFQLYGADFALDSKFVPWLIEINSSPDMAHTTPVTADLCPECLSDVIKVVVDRRERPGTTDTGKFDLIYKQGMPCHSLSRGFNMSIYGSTIQPPYSVTDNVILEDVTGHLSKFGMQLPVVSTNAIAIPSIDLKLQLRNKTISDEIVEGMKKKRSSRKLSSNLALQFGQKPTRHVAFIRPKRR